MEADQKLTVIDTCKNVTVLFYIMWFEVETTFHT